MSLMGLIAGGGALVAANKFGKQILRGWAKKAWGTEGAQILNSVISKQGWGVNFIPGVGPANFLRRAMTGSIAQGWKSTTGVLAAQKSRYAGILDNVMKDRRVVNFNVRKQITGIVNDSGVKGSKARQMEAALKGEMMNFTKSLKYNTMSSWDDMRASWGSVLRNNEVLSAYSSKIPLKDSMLRSADRVMDVAIHANTAKNLYGASLVSNMAVIGIPTLTSSVATYAIGRAVMHRTRRRLRGYEPIA